MARVTSSEYQEKHARNLKNSVPDIQRGVLRVPEAPGKRAAAKQEKMKQNLIKAIDDGKWARNVSAVPLQEWQEKMLNKGTSRIASGIDGAKDKVIAFADQLLPAVDAAAAKVHAMPDYTLQDSINRAATFMTEMSKFKKR